MSRITGVSLGDKLMTSEDGAVIKGAVVTVVGVLPNRLACRIDKLPDTDEFANYVKLGGKLFYVSSLIYVRDGQFDRLTA